MGEASVAQSTRCKVRVPQHGGPQVPAPALVGALASGLPALGPWVPPQVAALAPVPHPGQLRGHSGPGGTKGGCTPCVPGLGGSLLASPPCGWWAPPPFAVLALGQGEGLDCWPKGSSILC